MLRFVTVVWLALLATAPAYALDCDRLGAEFTKFDKAAIFFDRRSRTELASNRSETSSVKTASNSTQAAAMQSALTNIMLRQSMILNMMISRGCDLPDPPNFMMLGLIASNN